MNGPTLDLAEARQAIEGLTSADLLRLERAGRVYALTAGCDASDLLSEAICQTIEGKRNCPREMAIMPFLVGVMRSRAWASKQKASLLPELVSMDATSDSGQAYYEPATPELNAEQTALAKEDAAARRDALEVLFADDEQATLFLWADLEELSKEEIMVMNDLDITAYATIRRRMRRKLNAAFPNGWVS